MRALRSGRHKQKDRNEAEGIKQKKVEIIPLSFASLLLFVNIKA